MPKHRQNYIITSQIHGLASKRAHTSSGRKQNIKHARIYNFAQLAFSDAGFHEALRQRRGGHKHLKHQQLGANSWRLARQETPRPHSVLKAQSTSECCCPIEGGARVSPRPLARLRSRVCTSTPRRRICVLPAGLRCGCLEKAEARLSSRGCCHSEQRAVSKRRKGCNKKPLPCTCPLVFCLPFIPHSVVLAQISALFLSRPYGRAP
jgi:hypothetical protein